MKDYYEHTRNIFRITERLTDRFASGAANTTRSLFFPLLPRRGKTRGEKIGAFWLRDDQLFVERSGSFHREPELLMKAFEIAQERKRDAERGADRPDQPAASSGHARFSLRQRAARDFPAHSLAAKAKARACFG